MMLETQLRLPMKKWLNVLCEMSLMPWCLIFFLACTQTSTPQPNDKDTEDSETCTSTDGLSRADVEIVGRILKPNECPHGIQILETYNWKVIAFFFRDEDKDQETLKLYIKARKSKGYKLANEMILYRPEKLYLDDLDNDGNEEILFDEWTGGRIVSSNPTHILFTDGTDIRELLSEPMMKPVDLDGDGLKELIVFEDWQFYANYCRACSPEGVAVFSLKHGYYVHSSKNFRDYFRGRIRSKSGDGDEVEKADVGTAIDYLHMGNIDSAITTIKRSIEKVDASTQHEEVDRLHYILDDFKNYQKGSKSEVSERMYRRGARLSETRLSLDEFAEGC